MSTAIRSRSIPPPPADIETFAAQTVGTLPATINLNLYEGDDFYMDLTVTDSLGAAVSLVGATAKAEIHATVTDPTPLASFTCTTSTNVVHLHLPNIEAAKLSGPGVWDCQIAMPDITTLASGTVTVTQQVTP